MEENLNLLSKEQFYIAYLLLYISTTFIALVISTQIDFSSKKSNKISIYLSILTCIVLVIIIGFRAYDVGTDTINYYTFSWIMNLPPESNSEVFFYKILDFVKFFSSSFTIFLLTISSLFYFFIYKAFKNISIVYNANLFLILISFISLFFASTLTINVIRQGVSLALLIFGYSIWLRFGYNKKILLIVTLLLSFFTHTTSLIPILTFIFLIIIGDTINIKWYYFLFLIGIIFSSANLGLLNIAPFLKGLLGDTRRTSYLTSDTVTYIVGFKPQFVLFNTIFLILFIYINSILKKPNNYNITLKYYIIMSFVFFMAFQIPYSDRWGLFSWIFIPVLIAPLFSINVKYRLSSLTIFFLIFVFIFFNIYASTN